MIGRAARLVDGNLSAAEFLYVPYVWLKRRTHPGSGIASLSSRRAFLQGMQSFLTFTATWTGWGPPLLVLELIRRDEVQAACFLLGAAQAGSWVTENRRYVLLAAAVLGQPRGADSA